MVFSSSVFLFLFLPALLILYYIPFFKSRKWKNSILLLFSIGFYWWGEPIFVLLMLFSIFVNWLIGLQIEKSVHNKKIWLSFVVVFNVLLIGVFKYTSFLSKNLAALTGNEKFIVEIALPIGISFFTFQLMSYVFDVYYRYTKAQKNPFYVALYISLFPQLIAGPIVRYQQIEQELQNRRESFSELAEGMRRFIYGLGKKVLLANFLAQIADNVFDYTDNPSVGLAWLGAVAYTLQIYFDFSGYSDMAIGLGKMFGFHFPENFNYPYMANSITDFWRRWHMSLTAWFRDYVYIPLGGNRVKRSRWIMNMFVVWLLTGIWHGANWTFLLWGLFYFVVLLVEKISGLTKNMGIFAHVYTMLIVIVAWVFFRSADVASGFEYVGHMFGLGTNGIVDGACIETLKATSVILIASLIGTTPVLRRMLTPVGKKRRAIFESLWLLYVFSISVFEVVSSSYDPFIYFNF